MSEDDRHQTPRAASPQRHESDALFREMANGLPLIIWVHDENGEQVMVNDTFCEFFGVTREEMKGGRWQLLMHPDDADEYTAAFLAAVGERRSFNAQVRVKRADGEWRWIESWARPRFSDTGEFGGMVGTSADVTERKRAQERLREADRRKDEYLAMLGHELRNPLAAIQSATELLRLSSTDSRLERAIEVLSRQSEHAARLIDGLLEVSRIARGKLQLERAVVDLRGLCQQVVDDRMERALESGLELELELPAQPVWVFADRVRIAQILDNLLTNALKFTPPPGRIDVALRREGECALLGVRDTGVGIRSERLADIFIPFHQENAEVSRAAGGLGLGLALSKALVELHGGTIEARSSGPGSGTELSVSLGLVAPPTQEDEPGVDAATETRKILIVEDNDDAAEMLAELLKARGHRVTVARSGPEGLEILRREPHDVVLCDIGLPGMTGYELAQTVRGDPSAGDPTLVAVTGYGQREDQARAAAAGFDAHLVKPVALQLLEDILARATPGD